MLEKEFEYYLKNQDALVKNYNNKFIVIVGESVVGAYETYADAYFSSIKTLELGTFLIQKCTEGEEAYTQHFHSRVAFA
ncbi:MAG: hypothetical protein LBV75_06550 [Paludibacter sp.]|jgi:hypothetical protein|nr:hypothetical protein [Paludibacter sp.]